MSSGARPRYGFVAAALTLGVFFVGLQRYADLSNSYVGLAKAIVATAAAACVLYERYRTGRGRPVPGRRTRLVGLALAAAAVVCYFNGFSSQGLYWHRWDQFHYYMGAKYFRELGYDGLYKCVAVAQDQLGLIELRDDASGRTFRLDMSQEVRQPDRKIRNLGGDNRLMPLTDTLDHPERCTSLFSVERWNAFKGDVRFFRLASDALYWEQMQQDHGYNPPPVWTIAGSLLANLHPASTRYMRFLASLDIVYLAGAFALIWWAFGWRVFAVAAVFWGCQASAAFAWTAGAFLRQDWFFYFVASACFARKRYPRLAGAALAYAALLRIFPGLVVLGWLTVMGAFLMRRGRLAPSHRRALVGGAVAAAGLVALSVWVAGAGSYRQFYRHTLVVHDQTPVANHMGLRVLLSHDIRSTRTADRREYTRPERPGEPIRDWAQVRRERYEAYKGIGYVVVGLSAVFFVYAVRRVRLLWVGGCLGQVFIILMAQITCYYYSFLIYSALLTKAHRRLEAPLLGFAALTQLVYWTFYWNDDKYAALTLVSLLLCYGELCAFLPSRAWRRGESRVLGDGGGRETADAPAGDRAE